MTAIGLIVTILRAGVDRLCYLLRPRDDCFVTPLAITNLWLTSIFLSWVPWSIPGLGLPSVESALLLAGACSLLTARLDRRFVRRLRAKTPTRAQAARMTELDARAETCSRLSIPVPVCLSAAGAIAAVLKAIGAPEPVRLPLQIELGSAVILWIALLGQATWSFGLRIFLGYRYGSQGSEEDFLIIDTDSLRVAQRLALTVIGGLAAVGSGWQLLRTRFV